MKNLRTDVKMLFEQESNFFFTATAKINFYSFE